MTINDDVSGEVVDAAIKVHSALGPGLLESAYHACLSYELRQRGLRVSTQVELPVTYREIKIDLGYRLDLLVEQRIVVELKTVTKVLRVHEAQLLSYLKLGGFRAGLSSTSTRHASKTVSNGWSTNEKRHSGSP